MKGDSSYEIAFITFESLILYKFKSLVTKFMGEVYTFLYLINDK